MVVGCLGQAFEGDFGPADLTARKKGENFSRPKAPEGMNCPIQPHLTLTLQFWY